MRRICFVCHGNICRSTMAQSIFHWLDADGSFAVDSAATSGEEIGGGMYPPARRVLEAHGVPPVPHRARRLRKDEYGSWDLFVGFDDENVSLMKRLFGGDPEGKVRYLLPHEIADPWYTDDFETAYRDILAGCTELYEKWKRPVQ